VFLLFREGAPRFATDGRDERHNRLLRVGLLLPDSANREKRRCSRGRQRHRPNFEFFESLFLLATIRSHDSTNNRCAILIIRPATLSSLCLRISAPDIFSWQSEINCAASLNICFEQSVTGIFRIPPFYFSFKRGTVIPRCFAWCYCSFFFCLFVFFFLTFMAPRHDRWSRRSRL